MQYELGLSFDLRSSSAGLFRPHGCAYHSRHDHVTPFFTTTSLLAFNLWASLGDFSDQHQQVQHTKAGHGSRDLQTSIARRLKVAMSASRAVADLYLHRQAPIDVGKLDATALPRATLP